VLSDQAGNVASSHHLGLPCMLSRFGSPPIAIAHRIPPIHHPMVYLDAHVLLCWRFYFRRCHGPSRYLRSMELVNCLRHWGRGLYCSRNPLIYKPLSWVGIAKLLRHSRIDSPKGVLLQLCASGRVSVRTIWDIHKSRQAELIGGDERMTRHS
jgi:hypothetical protein